MNLLNGVVGGEDGGGTRRERERKREREGQSNNSELLVRLKK